MRPLAPTNSLSLHDLIALRPTLRRPQSSTTPSSGKNASTAAPSPWLTAAMKRSTTAVGVASALPPGIAPWASDTVVTVTKAPINAAINHSRSIAANLAVGLPRHLQQHQLSASSVSVSRSQPSFWRAPAMTYRASLSAAGSRATATCPRPLQGRSAPPEQISPGSAIMTKTNDPSKSLSCRTFQTV